MVAACRQAAEHPALAAGFVDRYLLDPPPVRQAQKDPRVTCRTIGPIAVNPTPQGAAIAKVKDHLGTYSVAPMVVQDPYPQPWR